VEPCHLQQTHLLHGDVATSTIRVRVSDTGGEEQREKDTVVRHLGALSPRGGQLLVPTAAHTWQVVALLPGQQRECALLRPLLFAEYPERRAAEHTSSQSVPYCPRRLSPSTSAAMASNVNMDPATFRSTMSTINQGNIMVAAARNLQKELLSQQGDQPRDASRAVVDMHDLEQVRVFPSGGAPRGGCVQETRPLVC
jgi:hypothetical protein